MFFLLMLLKKYVSSTYYLNSMYFSHAKGHMSILYVGCKKFPTNQLIEIYVHKLYIISIDFFFFFFLKKFLALNVKAA